MSLAANVNSLIVLTPTTNAKPPQQLDQMKQPAVPLILDSYGKPYDAILIDEAQATNSGWICIGNCPLFGCALCMLPQPCMQGANRCNK